MQNTNRTWVKLFALLLVLALVAPVAMAQEATEEPMEAVELPEVDPLSVTGDIITAGSSTVFPLTARMAELFEEEGYTGTITVDSVGTGAGFERFCVNAETDISNASRAIRDSEVEACRENGREPVEFYVGIDALGIVVSAENDFVDGLTIDQLGRIFGGEYTTWNQVNPDWPANPIALFSPGTDSGTYDYFVEEVMMPFAEAQGVVNDESTEDNEIAIAAEQAILGVQGTQFSENDNVLVEGVQGDPNAIGYFGFAYYEENADVIRVIPIDGIEPNEETAESGEYPLARPLFIYSDATIMMEKPQVAAFINFYLTNVNNEVLSVGYFPVSEEALNEAKLNWLVAMGMAE
jgi:phosphate binding protein